MTKKEAPRYVTETGQYRTEQQTPSDMSDAEWYRFLADILAENNKAKRIEQARDALIEAVEKWADARKSTRKDGRGYADESVALEAAHDTYREAIK